MASTPSPMRRAHTPPTPLHGPRHDNYEPYSPRRSTRVATQRKNFTISHPVDSSPSRSKTKSSRSTRAVTPTGRPASSQTFSPPSSPISPVPQLMSSKKRSSMKPALKPVHARFEMGLSDSDFESREPSSALAALRMLPTPAKTPRKRAIQPQVSLASTARVLFQDRPATIDEVVPETKRNQRGRKNPISLASFEELEEDEPKNITIFTDSKERVPEVDETDENPFIVRRNANGAPKTRGEARRRKLDSKAEEMERAVKNDEGLIFTFRGKRVFRKFESSGDEDDAEISSDIEVRRQAGVNKRLTRSSIKPRLLFPNAEQIRAREAAAKEAEEEAPTDIETPHVDHSDGMDIEEHVDHSDGMDIEEHVELETPVKEKFSSPSTPSFARVSRSKAKAIAVEPELAPTAKPADESPGEGPSTPVQAKKPSPFSSWRRTKVSVSVKSTKREGEPLEKNSDATKRTRSTNYAP